MPSPFETTYPICTICKSIQRHVLPRSKTPVPASATLRHTLFLKFLAEIHSSHMSPRPFQGHRIMVCLPRRRNAAVVLLGEGTFERNGCFVAHESLFYPRPVMQCYF